MLEGRLEVAALAQLAINYLTLAVRYPIDGLRLLGDTRAVRSELLGQFAERRSEHGFVVLRTDGGKSGSQSILFEDHCVHGMGEASDVGAPDDVSGAEAEHTEDDGRNEL